MDKSDTCILATPNMRRSISRDVLRLIKRSYGLCTKLNRVAIKTIASLGSQKVNLHCAVTCGIKDSKQMARMIVIMIMHSWTSMR